MRWVIILYLVIGAMHAVNRSSVLLEFYHDSPFALFCSMVLNAILWLPTTVLSIFTQFVRGR